MFACSIEIYGKQSEHPSRVYVDYSQKLTIFHKLVHKIQISSHNKQSMYKIKCPVQSGSTMFAHSIKIQR